ncbi:MAG TPA: hypothetical protein PLM16_00045 [Candidatus Woesebacteria bacterium]|nr:hypothetical protein [Candidatus Woesebacteria bacterium]
MAVAKYKQLYQMMRVQEESLFAEFAKLHQRYQQSPKQHQAEFNRQGEQVLEVVRDWERRLCSPMGRTIYGQYSNQVSEKFWQLVRDEFPAIDMVGVKIE